MLMTTITIADRFNGPPTSGNGGYVCGMLANTVYGAAEVTLKAPPPLGRPLAIAVAADGASLIDGETILASARGTDLDIDVPEAPTLDEAVVATTRCHHIRGTQFTSCFVCGPDRHMDDGLCILAGPTSTPGMVAAPWRPHESLAGRDGRVAPEFLWAALDCPGFFAIRTRLPKVTGVLGRLTAEINDRPKPNETCIVAGWDMGSDGRKHFAGTAIYRPDGTVLARAKAVWIEIKL